MNRPEPQPHWTERSVDDYKSRIAFDFLTQLSDYLETSPLNQRQLAAKLGVGESAVSQFLNNPSNLTLKAIIRYTRALGLKVSLLAYDDDDPDNTRGPIGSDVFTECWIRQGRPSIKAEDNPVHEITKVYWSQSTSAQMAYKAQGNILSPVVSTNDQTNAVLKEAA